MDTFEGFQVLALRYEDLPFQPSFTKAVFVGEVAKGGFRNKKRTFLGVPKKATLVNLNHLPAEVKSKVMEGMYSVTVEAVIII